MTHALTELVNQAQRTLDAPVQEGARIMQICNACRYCEGFCAVFPAMTRRLEFAKTDIHYLANLCHSCGACLHACQYAPPHEFAVNVPRTLSVVRAQTYSDFAWPRAFAGAYQRHGWLVVLALIASLLAFLLAAASNGGWVRGDLDGDFYKVFGHGSLVSVFAPVFGFSILAMAVGGLRFWRSLPDSRLSTPVVTEAVGASLSLKYLDGNNAGQGDGCAERDDQSTHWRRRLHHATFYGFMLCLMSTTVATGYHYVLGLPAPYALSSVPKLLGIVGGVLLCAGTLGLAALKWIRHPLHRDAQSAAMDWGLILALFAVSSTGLLLMCVRLLPATTAHTPWVLALHLACVLAFFVVMPYGKLVHGIYRGLALLRFSIEIREPSRRKLGSD